MKSDQILARVDASWDELAGFVKTTEIAALDVPGPDGWALKDHLVHLAAWERSLLAVIPCLRIGKIGMSRALSDDLRSRVLAASADGMSARSAAARFEIGISTAIACIANARAK